MPSLRRVAITLALLATTAAAGCANQSGARPGAPAVAPLRSPATDSHRDAAVREATRILATFRPPAGAHALANRPAGAALLSRPLAEFGTPNTADETRWWTTTGDAESLVTGLVPPPGAVAGDSSNDGGPATVAYGVSFDWPAVTGVLDNRELQVAALRVGDATILRVDGLATWVPDRPPASLVPTTATSVIVAYTPGNRGQQMAGSRSYGPVPVTTPARVAALVTAINAQPMQQPGARPCPFAGGGHMDLEFRSAIGSAATATVTIDTDGCGDVAVDVQGATATLAGGPTLAARVESIADLRWPAVT